MIAVAGFKVVIFILRVCLEFTFTCFFYRVKNCIPSIPF